MSTSQNDDNLDEGFEDLDAATEDPAATVPPLDEEGDALAAPTRKMTSGGGSKKNLFILLGLLAVLALGGGGAYLYLTGGDGDLVAVPSAPLPAPAAPSEATFAAPADPSAAPPIDPLAAPPADTATAMSDPSVPPPEALTGAPAGTPDTAATAAEQAAAIPGEAATGMPADPANAVLAAPPAADPAAIVTTDPAAVVTTDPAAVVTADPATVVATDSPVVVAADPVAVTPAAEEPADLGAPPAEENVAVPLTPATPAETVVVVPADAATATTTVTTTTAPVTPAPGEPQPDLPMPEQAAQVPATTTTTSITTTVTQPATPAGTTPDPSAAELAIVQNAAILDQVTQPGTVARPFDPNAPAPSPANAMKEVEKLLQQEAIVRPLPPAWLQVKKNYNADDMDSRLTAARSALGQNRNSAALQLFTELRAKYPKDYRVLMGRAVALQKLGQNDEALGAYEEVLNADPRNLEALTNMLGLLKGNDPQLAVAKLAELHDAYPYQADITAQLGVAYGQAGEYEQALRYLEMAEAMDPGSAYILYNKAVLHDKMGHATQAGDLYRQLLRIAADGRLDENLPLEQIKRRLSVLR